MSLVPKALCFFLIFSLIALASDLEFSGVSPDYVPEGKSRRQSKIMTLKQCEAACGANPQCKAYAFRTSKPACYFYSKVYMGGTPLTRQMGMYSSGLSIIPKKGYISAFKQSSFPPRPVMIREQK
jgi:hypothetical protein